MLYVFITAVAGHMSSIRLAVTLGHIVNKWSFL